MRMRCMLNVSLGEGQVVYALHGETDGAQLVFQGLFAGLHPRAFRSVCSNDAVADSERSRPGCDSQCWAPSCVRGEQEA